jgi:diadenylate cyclase
MQEWLVYGTDVGIVAVLLYLGLRLLKRAAVVRLIVGLFLLVGLYLLAATFRLQTLYWLIDNLFNSLLLITVIIFQSDIRRVLHTATRQQHLSGQVADDVSQRIDEFIAAVDTLANRQIGALIVVERNMPLDQYMAIGTDIDAKMTGELLTSIFLPYSPIHDGAVIVRKGKITKAGCFLPLTTNPDIAKELGTRHRAAIGITEIADAFVVVVSEETGSISLALDGRLQRNLDLATLRKQILRYVEPKWLV